MCIHMAQFEEGAYCHALGQGPVPPIMDDNHHVMPYLTSPNQNPLDDLVYKPAVETLPVFDQQSPLDGLIYEPAVEALPEFNQNTLDDLFYKPAVQE